MLLPTSPTQQPSEFKLNPQVPDALDVTAVSRDIYDGIPYSAAFAPRDSYMKPVVTPISQKRRPRADSFCEPNPPSSRRPSVTFHESIVANIPDQKKYCNRCSDKSTPFYLLCMSSLMVAMFSMGMLIKGATVCEGAVYTSLISFIVALYINIY